MHDFLTFLQWLLSQVWGLPVFLVGATFVFVAVCSAVVKANEIFQRHRAVIGQVFRAPITLLIGWLAWVLPLPFWHWPAFFALAGVWVFSNWLHDRERTEAVFAALWRVARDLAGMAGKWALARVSAGVAIRAKAAKPVTLFATPQERAIRAGASVFDKTLIKWGVRVVLLLVVAMASHEVMQRFGLLGPSRDALKAQVREAQTNLDVLEHEKKVAGAAIDLAERTHAVERRGADLQHEAEEAIHEAVSAEDFDALDVVYERAYRSVWDDGADSLGGDSDPPRLRGLYEAVAG